jgi:hypothetical protein
METLMKKVQRPDIHKVSTPVDYRAQRPNKAPSSDTKKVSGFEDFIKAADDAACASIQRITVDDVVDHFYLPPSEAVEFLLKKSPVGEKCPSKDDLISKGYLIGYSNEDDGSCVMPAAHGFGMIAFEPVSDDGTKTVVYNNGSGFEQVMKYDKDGNLVSADFDSIDVNTRIRLGTVHMKVVNGEKKYSN